MTALAIAGRNIRTDEVGRFSLNDLHRAAGHESRHKPGNWLHLDQTRELAAELEREVAGITATQTKRGIGSFVRRELAIAYAAWISPVFHLRVIRSFDSLASARPREDMHAALNDPATLRALLLDQTDNRLRLESEAERLQDEVDRTAPQAAAYERIAGQKDAVSLTAAGKVLGIQQHQFIAWLSQRQWIYRAAAHGSWLGQADRIKRGHLTHRMLEIERSAGFIQIKPQVLVTASGIAKLAALLEQASTA